MIPETLLPASSSGERRRAAEARGPVRAWDPNGPAASSVAPLLWEALRDSQCGLSMAETAENLARQYGVGREAVDCYAALSQSRARDAWGRGDYADEVVPVMLTDRKSREPRPCSSSERPA